MTRPHITYCDTPLTRKYRGAARAAGPWRTEEPPGRHDVRPRTKTAPDLATLSNLM